MSAHDDGGPAFPSRGGLMFYVPESVKGEVERAVAALDQQYTGLTLRDYFAITLLAGDAKSPGEGCDGYMEQRARVAYAYADAMLRARQA